MRGPMPLTNCRDVSRVSSTSEMLSAGLCRSRSRSERAPPSFRSLPQCCASPGLSVRGAGFQTRENTLPCHDRGFNPGENAPSSKSRLFRSCEAAHFGQVHGGAEAPSLQRRLLLSKGTGFSPSVAQPNVEALASEGKPRYLAETACRRLWAAASSM